MTNEKGQMKEVKAIRLTVENEPDIMGLINELASVLGIMPTSALKVFLRRSLPRFIKNEQKHLTQINRTNQGKS
jgi:hypothetical protein